MSQGNPTQAPTFTLRSQYVVLRPTMPATSHMSPHCHVTTTFFTFLIRSGTVPTAHPKPSRITVIMKYQPVYNLLSSRHLFFHTK